MENRYGKDTQAHVGRRYSRRACEPCRRYKRKCDGQKPCYSCQRYDYQCHFDESGRRRARVVHRQDAVLQGPRSTDLPLSTSQERPVATPPTPSSTLQETQPQPISQHGQVPTPGQFAQDLISTFCGTCEDSTSMLAKHYSWNLALRLGAPFENSLTQLLSLADAQKYSRIYFDKVHPVYPFVDEETFSNQITRRWDGGEASNEYDAVICGVVALGSLFSQSEPLPQEAEVSQLARTVLDTWNPVHLNAVFSLEAGMALVLRVLYYRLSKDTHSAWIASGAALAAIEGRSGHNEPSADDMTRCTRYESYNTPAERDLHARIHWIATALHTWICYEYGPIKEPTTITKSPCMAPASHHPRESLSSFISVFEITLAIVNAIGPNSLPRLTNILDSVSDLQHRVEHDVVQLHLCFHICCIYRYMRQTNAIIPTETLTKLIDVGKVGLAAALRLARDSQPWWHVINYPFHFLCLLLAMDVRESLAEVEGTMNTLRTIESCFTGRTDRVREVIAMGERLIAICWRFKTEAAETLARSKPSVNPDYSMVTSFPDASAGSGLLETPPSSLDDFDLSLFDLERFDWDAFLH